MDEILSDFLLCGEAEVRKNFSSDERVEFLQQLINIQVAMLQNVADDMGITLYTTGHIKNNGVNLTLE